MNLRFKKTAQRPQSKEQKSQSVPRGGMNKNEQHQEGQEGGSGEFELKPYYKPRIAYNDRINTPNTQRLV
jgi:hypothetical protein